MSLEADDSMTLNEAKAKHAVLTALASVMKPECIDKWMLTPHELLGDVSPNEAIHHGKLNDVLHIVRVLDSGLKFRKETDCG